MQPRNLSNELQSAVNEYYLACDRVWQENNGRYRQQDEGAFQDAATEFMIKVSGISSEIGSITDLHEENALERMVASITKNNVRERKTGLHFLPSQTTIRDVSAALTSVSEALATKKTELHQKEQRTLEEEKGTLNDLVAAVTKAAISCIDMQKNVSGKNVKSRTSVVEMEMTNLAAGKATEQDQLLDTIIDNMQAMPATAKKPDWMNVLQNEKLREAVTSRILARVDLPQGAKGKLDLSHVLDASEQSMLVKWIKSPTGRFTSFVNSFFDNNKPFEGQTSSYRRLFNKSLETKGPERKISRGS